jgi:hypothetical protein
MINLIKSDFAQCLPQVLPELLNLLKKSTDSYRAILSEKGKEM